MLSLVCEHLDYSSACSMAKTHGSFDNIPIFSTVALFVIINIIAPLVLHFPLVEQRNRNCNYSFCALLLDNHCTSPILLTKHNLTIIIIIIIIRVTPKYFGQNSPLTLMPENNLIHFSDYCSKVEEIGRAHV